MREKFRKDLESFWPVFLGAHLHPMNQRFHAFGTLFMFTNFALFVLTAKWVFFGLAFCGYVPSWIGHLFIEKNTPPTLGNPIVAGFCELKMVALMIAGELENEQERLFGSPRAAPGTRCLLTREQELAYQDSLRFRIRENIPSHPFGDDYWKIFLLKHQSLACVAIHSAAMIYLYALSLYIVFSGRWELIVAIPLTQLIGLASHAIFERNHIDFEDAIFSPRAFLCLNRMLLLFLSGRYFKVARAANGELASHLELVSAHR